MLSPFLQKKLIILLKVRVLATLDHPNIVTYYDRLGGHRLINIITIISMLLSSIESVIIIIMQILTMIMIMTSFERDGVLMIEMEYHHYHHAIIINRISYHHQLS